MGILHVTVSEMYAVFNQNFLKYLDEIKSTCIHATANPWATTVSWRLAPLAVSKAAALVFDLCTPLCLPDALLLLPPLPSSRGFVNTVTVMSVFPVWLLKDLKNVFLSSLLNFPFPNEYYLQQTRN